MLKRTALFDEHVKLSGRMVDFGGWELPVQYSGLIQEHTACRTAAGLFDVSHMGEIFVEGARAQDYLNYLVTNNVAKLADHQALYTAMCNDSGGIVDDLVIYKFHSSKFLVVVNASNSDKDFAWMKRIAKEFAPDQAGFTLRDASVGYSQIAIQGPKAAQILQTITQTDLASIKTYWFTEGALNVSSTESGAPIPAIIARTGYTGEDGFELYVSWEAGPLVWRSLLKAGEPLGLKPCGLGARDTLRLEMKYALYGHELSETTNAIEAGLGWVTKFDKGDFVGKRALEQVKNLGPTRKLVGLLVNDRRIPRQGYTVYSKDGAHAVGEITSGTQSPSTKENIAIAYIESEFSGMGTELLVEIRDAKSPAKIVPTPFYKRSE